MKITRHDIAEKVKPKYPELKLPIKELLNSYMTPESVLSMSEFGHMPQIIRPSLVHNFDDLVNYRNEIRRLELVPVKTPEVHDLYNGLDKTMLLRGLREAMGDEPIVMLENQYPYALPPDTNQYLIWYDQNSWVNSRELIAAFLGILLTHMEVEPNDFVSFERPLTGNAKLIRGTFRQLNHLHLWTRKR